MSAKAEGVTSHPGASKLADCASLIRATSTKTGLSSGRGKIDRRRRPVDGRLGETTQSGIGTLHAVLRTEDKGDLQQDQEQQEYREDDSCRTNDRPATRKIMSDAHKLPQHLAAPPICPELQTRPGGEPEMRQPPVSGFSGTSGGFEMTKRCE